jgi:hypothetical protein
LRPEPAGFTAQSLVRIPAPVKPIRVTARYSDEIGKTLAVVKAPRASFQLTGAELYVRAVVRSNQPSTRKDLPEQGWTQPVGWEKRL